ncbi:MAG: hypothetical protein AB7I42_22900 [Bradyrhizobium sp.]|uniref:hypothetical protein n=1 Tax=Bradyrhizobium sp. TaxID=376 RepID=UPI003D0AE9BD
MAAKPRKRGRKRPVVFIRGSYGVTEGRSSIDIAKLLGVAKQAVSQRERMAIRKLWRRPLQPHWREVVEALRQAPVLGEWDGRQEVDLPVKPQGKAQVASRRVG